MRELHWSFIARTAVPKGRVVVAHHKMATVGDGAYMVARRPGAVAWIASGVVVDVVLWLVLIQLPIQNPLHGLLAVAVALCWGHLVVMPWLVWLGRVPRLAELQVASSGLIISIVAVGIGFVVGYPIGILGFFLLGMPGLLVGGAIAGWLTSFAMRAIGSAATSSSPRRSAAGACCAPVILLFGSNSFTPFIRTTADLNAAGYSSQAMASDLGVLTAMICAGVVASLITAPVWTSSWPRPAIRDTLAAVAVVSFAVSYLAITSKHEALQVSVNQAIGRLSKEVRSGCEGAVISDCLSDAAFAVARAQVSSWLPLDGSLGSAAEVAKDLARLNRADQARLLARLAAEPDPEALDVLVAAGQVAAAARSDPERPADLASLNRLGSTAILIQAFDAVTASLTARPQRSPYRYKDSNSSQPPLTTLLPQEPVGLPTLRLVAQRWAALLPLVPKDGQRKASFGLARLNHALLQYDSRERLLQFQSRYYGMHPSDWLLAGDGEQALIAGARENRLDLAAASPWAVRLIKTRGGATPAFWQPFRDLFPARLDFDMTSRNPGLSAGSNTRAMVRTLWRLGDVEHARRFADTVEARAQIRNTVDSHTLAAAVLRDVGSVARADAALSRAFALLPENALKCDGQQVSGESLTGCTLASLDPDRKWTDVAVQASRSDVHQRDPIHIRDLTLWLAIAKERLADGTPVDKLGLVFDKVGDRIASLIELAFACWAEGDVAGTRAMIMRIVDRPFDSRDAEALARLAVALGDPGLARQLATSMLDRMAKTPINYGAWDKSTVAVWWHELGLGQ